jgi:phospholipase D1/2
MSGENLAKGPSAAAYFKQCDQDSSNAVGSTTQCCRILKPRDHHLTLYNDSTDVKGTAGAFHDMVRAIEDAQHFIFIVGWSFHPLFVPVRSAGISAKQSIGALLIEKAKEVTVAIHTWDHSYKGAKDPHNDNGETILDSIAKDMGLEGVPKNLRWRASSRESVGWSHHQKFVVCDYRGPLGANGKRDIKVFFGGLDLTKGRFDRPDHRISPQDAVARELQKAWGTKDRKWLDVNEWYNAEFTNPKKALTLPRQPWHDVHGALRGAAAWDFVREFVGRWHRDPSHGYSAIGDTKMLAYSNNLVWTTYRQLRVDKKSVIIQPEDSQYSRGPWAAQVCRSITKAHWGVPIGQYYPRGSLLPLAPVDRQLADEFKWRSQSDPEMSILDAYQESIRKAENFIYIETQYLIGSGERWHKNQLEGIKNDVPWWIVEKILERAGSDFHVYIVLPMFPEGDPTDGNVRAVRCLIWRTICFMINALDGGLKHINSPNRWDHYLSFYFLANWKRIDKTQQLKPIWQLEQELKEVERQWKEATIRHSHARAQAVNSRHASDRVYQELRRMQEEIDRCTERRLQLEKAMSREERVRKHDRYMVYVHSKMMIVDDQRIILGSANLNERSLAGDRDSEIACSLHPNLAGSPSDAEMNKRDCREKLQDFRQQLWLEHFGSALPENWKSPGSKPCSESAKRIADQNYRNFRSMSADPIGHICRWPLTLKEDGVIFESRAGTIFTEQESFIPDASSSDDKWKWRSPGSRILWLHE